MFYLLETTVVYNVTNFVVPTTVERAKYMRITVKKRRKEDKNKGKEDDYESPFGDMLMAYRLVLY